MSICESGLVKNELKDPSDSQLLNSSGELHNLSVASVGSLGGGMAGALLGGSYLMKGGAQATLQQPSQCASADSSSSFVLAPPIGNSSHVPRSNPNSASSYMPAYEGLAINGVGSPLEAFANVALQQQQQQQQQPPAVPSPMGSSSSFHELKPQPQTRPNIPLSQQQQYHQIPSLSVQPTPYYAQNAAVPSLFSADGSSLSLHSVPTSLHQNPPQPVSAFYSPQYAQQAAPPILHAQSLEAQTMLIHQQLAAQARSTNSPYVLSASSTPRPMPAQSPLYTPAVVQSLSQVSQVQFATPAQHAHFANLSASSASIASFLPPGTLLNGSSVLPTSSLVPNTSNSSSSHKRSRTQSSVVPQIVNSSINSSQRAQHSAGKRRKYEFNAGGMWNTRTPLQTTVLVF